MGGTFSIGEEIGWSARSDAAMYVRLLCAAFLPAYLFVAVPAIAEELPTAAAIRAHIETAVGPEPASYRKVVDETEAGERDRTVTIYRGDDYLETDEQGPSKTSKGRYHGQRWRQNENGETILEPPDRAETSVNSYAETVERISAPVDGYVLSSLDVEGRGTKEYVDRATWRIVRKDDIRAAQTTITLYDDFRTIGGYTFAAHESSSDGVAVDSTDSRVGIVPVPPTDSDLAIPASSASFVEFPAGKKVVVLPVHVDGNRFIVRVNIGGRGLDMQLDSGAGDISIEDGIVDQLRLARFGAYSNAANAGRFEESHAIVPEMKIGELTLRNVFISTVPKFDETRFMSTTRIVGLLGFDFIDAMTLKLDYYDEKLTAYAPGAFTEPPTQEGQFDLDIRLRGNVPIVDVDIDGVRGDRFIIDTGADDRLLIFDYFARRHPTAIVDEGGGGQVRDDTQMRGIGGEFSTRPVQLASVRFGPVNFTDFLTHVVTQRGVYDYNDDGLFGAGFLYIFDVTFDYAHGKAYFAFHG
jgi:predicted aspartyl protease